MMSSHESPLHDTDQPSKKRIQRRHGACEPCRSSKTKCDGRMPCGACRSERRKQCPCVYSEKALKLQQVTAEVRRKYEAEGRSEEESRSFSQDDPHTDLFDGLQEAALHSLSFQDRNEPALSRSKQERIESNDDVESARMSHALSVCTAVEEFKKFKPSRGYSAQVVGRCHGFQVLERGQAKLNQQPTTVQDALTTSGPTTCSSLDLSQDSTEMQILGSRLDAADRLVQDGQLSQAWGDLGGILRHAQIYQETFEGDGGSAPSPKWRFLWNKMLDLETQVGLTIGRPICPVVVDAKRSGPTDGTLSLEETLDETRNDLYQHIQGMLELKLSSPTAIRDFLERARDIINHEPFNQIGLCTTERHSVAVRDLHLNTHLLFMLVYCRMASLCDCFSRDLTNVSWSESPAADIIRSLNLHQPRQKRAFCRKMFRSANFILDSFISLHQHHNDLTGYQWIRSHTAFSAAVVLGIAKLRHEVEWHVTTEKLKRIEQVFVQLSQSNPHCHLYNTALERLRDLGSVKEPASEATLYKHSGLKKRKRSAPEASPVSSQSSISKALEPDSTSASAAASPPLTVKRGSESVNNHASDNTIPQGQRATGHSRQNGADPSGPVTTTAYEDLQLGHISFFDDNPTTYGPSSSSFSSTNASVSSCASSATSFTDPGLPMMPGTDVAFDHPGPPFAFPFPHNIFHPPMTWNNTMYPLDAHGASSLPLHSSAEMSSFTQDPSTVGGEDRLRLDTNVSPRLKASNETSAYASPIQTSSRDSAAPSRLSPSSQIESGFNRMTTRAVGQNFQLPVSNPMPGNESAAGIRRPPLHRSVSESTAPQVSPVVNTNVQGPSMDWHAPSSVATSHDMTTSLTNSNLGMTDLDQRARINDLRQPNVSTHRSGQGSSYVQQVPTQPSSRTLRHQFFPQQLGGIASTPGIFEQQQLHAHYQPAQIMSYPRYIVSESGHIIGTNVY